MCVFLIVRNDGAYEFSCLRPGTRLQVWQSQTHHMHHIKAPEGAIQHLR